MKAHTNTTKSTIPLGASSALVWTGEGDITFLWTDEREQSTKGTTYCKNVEPAQVKAILGDIPVDSGWLPPHVRRWGLSSHGIFVVAFIQPQVYDLRLTNTWDKPRFGAKKVLRLRCPLPGFVFAGRGTDYRVWALAEDFSPLAKLQRAPLPNTYVSEGSICWGSNVPPVCAPDTILNAWKVFITSPFNDHLVGGQSQSQKDVREVLLQLAEAEANVYPVKDLVPCQQYTVDAAVRQFIGLSSSPQGLRQEIDDDEPLEDEDEVLDLEEEEMEA